MSGKPCFDGQRYAQPRPQDGRVCILRFEDADVGDMVFNDPAEAWAAWNQHSPAWNCTLLMAAEFPAFSNPGHGMAAGEVQPVSDPCRLPARWKEAPFSDGAPGDRMFKAAWAYLSEYVFSTEGPDHEPTDFERALLEDYTSGLMSDDAFFAPVRDLLAAAPHPPEEGQGWRPTHRHLKRGTEYQVLGEACLQQASQFGPVEGDLITFYRGPDGQLWARASSEFNDGRFEPLNPEGAA